MQQEGSSIMAGKLLVRQGGSGFARLFSQKGWQEKECCLTTREFLVFKVPSPRC